MENFLGEGGLTALHSGDNRRSICGRPQCNDGHHEEQQYSSGREKARKALQGTMQALKPA